MKMKGLILLAAAFIIFLRCADNSTESQNSLAKIGANDFVKVTVELQNGFAGKEVRISHEDRQIYYSSLSNLVPLAGPEASFTTYLPQCCQVNDDRTRMTLITRINTDKNP